MSIIAAPVDQYAEAEMFPHLVSSVGKAAKRIICGNVMIPRVPRDALIQFDPDPSILR